MYEKAKSSWMKHLDFTILDLLCLEAAYLLAFLFRDVWIFNADAGIGRLSISPLSDLFYRQIGIVLVGVHLLLVFFRQCYKDILRRGYFLEFKSVVAQNTLILIGVLLYMYVTKSAVDFSRAIFGVTWVLGILLMYGARLAWKRLIRKKVMTDANLPRVLLLTEGARAEEVVRHIKAYRYNEFRLAGIVLLDERRIGAQIGGEIVVADASDMFDYVLANVVDAVLFCENLDAATRELYAYRFLSMGQTVHINLDILSADLPNKLVQELGNMAVVTSSIKTADVRQLFVKRLMDIAGGLVGCVIMAVAAVFLTPVIKLQAPGPIFFVQTRVGKNGRTFQFYKFRSMYADAERRKAELMKRNEMQGQMFKMEHDPRIFPAGHFMRKYSVDELPQFINVLKGDMSLVGTRPPTVDEYENYDLHHKVRLSIKPGLTGLWQVSGRSSIKDFNEVVKLDEKYIESWNIGLDIKILLKTVGVVFGAKGSM